jgi:hypothetical protein
MPIKSLTKLKTGLSLALVLAGFILESNVYADSNGAGRAMVGAGSIEFGLEGRWDSDPDDDTVAYMNLQLGYFITDGHEIGVKSLFGTNEVGNRDHNGVFYEWNWVNGSKFLPHLGGALMHAAPAVGAEQTDNRYLSSWLGVKLILARNAALAFQYQFDYATGDTFGPEGDRKRRNREFNLGLRLFF